MISVDNIGAKSREKEGSLLPALMGVLLLGVFMFRKYLFGENKVFNSLLFFSIWEAIIIVVFNHESFNNLVGHIFMVTMPVMSYYLSYNLSTLLDEKRNEFQIIFFVVLVYLVYRYIEIILSSGGFGSGHFAVAYYPMFLLPLVLLTSSKWLKYICLFIIIAVVLSSGKRTGLLAMSLGLFAYIYVSEYLKRKDIIRTMVVGFFFVTILGCIIIFIGDEFGGESINRLLQMRQQDQSEARDYIYAEVYNMITRSDFTHFFVGHGFSSVIRDSILGFSAHNDFLEIAYDYGLIGLVLYILFYYNSLKCLILNIRYDSIGSAEYASLMVMFFVLSMTSHVVIYILMTLFTFIQGYLQGKMVINMNDQQ